MTISTTWFPWMNALLVVFCAWMIWRGWKKGFLIQLLNLISALVSFFVSFAFGKVLSSMFSITSLFPALNSLSAIEQYAVNWLFWIVAVFIVLRILFSLIYGSIKALKKIRVLNLADHICGALLAVITAWILCSVIAAALSLPFFTNGAKFVAGSFLSPMNAINMQLLNTALYGTVNFQTISEIVARNLQ